MYPRAFLVVPFVLCSGLGMVGCAGGPPFVDLGDRSTGNLLWGASHYLWEDRDLDKALAYANAGLEIHGDEARAQQASLSDFVPTDPAERVYEYRTLNNVGLIALARAEVLLAQGDRAGAEQAFSALVEEFGYAQFQDLGEWRGYASTVARDDRGFVKLADVATARLADLKAGRD